MLIQKTHPEDLKRKIIRAFAAVPSPRDEIAPHECDECREVRKTFAGKNWKTIEPEILAENYGIIPLFSPAAFRFFLPAYLVYSLEHFSEDDSTVEFTIYALTPRGQDVKERLDYWRERFENFTSEQMDCVYEFLDLVGADESFHLFFADVERGRRNLKEFIEPV